MSRHDENEMECTECTELMELLAEHLEGETSLEMRRELMEHVQSCDQCARLLWSLRRVIGYCRTETRYEVPGEVHREFWQVLVREIRIEREEPDA
jgi:hypothetical protein